MGKLAELTGIDARRVDTIRRALERADVRSFSQLAATRGIGEKTLAKGAGVGTPTGSHTDRIGVMSLSVPATTGPDLLGAAIRHPRSGCSTAGPCHTW